MRHLRAFLYAKNASGDWSVSIFRELEPLAEAASNAIANDAGCAAIHIGFWRLDTEEVKRLAEAYPGWLLASASTVGSMREPARFSAASIGTADGAIFYLALAGFGYVREDETAAFRDCVPADKAAHQPSIVTPGWLQDLQRVNPSLAEAAVRAKIVDEESYQEKEVDLDTSTRFALGMSRFEFLAGRPPSQKTIFDDLWAAPPWFMQVTLDSLDLTTRMVNAFQAHKLFTIADVSPLGEAGMFKLPRLGATSLRTLGRLIVEALSAGKGHISAQPPGASLAPLDRSFPIAAILPSSSETLVAMEREPASFIDGIRVVGENLSEQQRGVWAARMGFKCKPMTLREIGDQLGVTRERVRQIEGNIYVKLARDPLWRALARRLDAALTGRESPLLIQGLSAVDPWFVGCDDLADAFEVIFDRLLDRRFTVLNVGGVPVITHLSRTAWREAIQWARRLLEHGATDLIPESFARSLCDGVLVDVGEELRDDLWEEAIDGALWTEDEPRRLAGLGRKAEQIVLAVLEASDVPLHFTEIERRAVEMGAVGRGTRRLPSATQEVAVLYDRGVYGLPKHCPLSAVDLCSVRAEVENLIAGVDPTRQWHAAELCEALVSAGFGFAGRLTKYLVNYALQESESLAYLRRMVWGLKEEWKPRAASRLDLRQAVVALLERAGGPLTTAEIKRQLAQARGLSETFQIFPAASLVRLAPGLWGLDHRDIDLEVCLAIARRTRKRLAELGRGIHLAELASELGDLQRQEEIQRAVTAVGDREGVELDRVQCAYLVEWGESRRVAPTDAVKRALQEAGDNGVSIAAVVTRASEIALRDIPVSTVSQCLQAIEEAEFDSEDGVWRLAIQL